MWENMNTENGRDAARGCQVQTYKTPNRHLFLSSEQHSFRQNCNSTSCVFCSVVPYQSIYVLTSSILSTKR